MSANSQEIDWADEDGGPACGWLQQPGTRRYGCVLPAGHFGYCKAGIVPADVLARTGEARAVPDAVKAKMIAAYPTISGMTGDFLAWHATPGERDEAWQRITASRNMRDILDATYPDGWR